jgi:hypothetical protein
MRKVNELTGHILVIENHPFEIFFAQVHPIDFGHYEVSIALLVVDNFADNHIFDILVKTL